MRVALLSDIHANKAALIPVLQDITKLNIKHLIISGDLVGYYYDIKEVLDMLNSFTLFFCKGNHEVMLENLINNKISRSELKLKYGSSLFMAESELNSSQINFLTKSDHPLEINLDGKAILVSHGAPWDINQYIYRTNIQGFYNKFDSYNHQIFVIGNTHYQMELQYGQKLIINPGSVGQSRKNFGYAEWAMLDLESMQTEFFSIKYSTKKLIDQCRKIDPDCQLLTKHLG
jgi:predicted phosphodiesterase